MDEGRQPVIGGLENRLEFETLISDASASLFGSQPEELEPAVERALERVRVFFQADRCALLTVSDDETVVKIRLAVFAEGVPVVPPDANLAPIFPWSRHKLLVERMPVRIPRITDLPTDADAERAAWRQMSIQSALTLPIEAGGRVKYLIVLNTVFRQRDWPDVFVSRLRVLGGLLVNALERQAMFDELREAKERADLAADSAEAGLWTLDLQTGVFWLSDRDRVIFGFAPDEVIDLPRVAAAIHPEDWPSVERAIERSTRSPETLEVEYRIVPPGDGRERWITSRGRTHFSAAGEPERLMGVSIDITDRKRAQERHRRSDLRLVSGAELAGLAFYEVDLAAATAYVDDRFRDLCGLPTERETGLQPLEFWLEHLHPDDRRRVLDLRGQLHEGRVNRISLEYRFQHPLEGLRWIHHLAGVARRDEGGRAVATYGVLREITVQKQTEDDLRELSRRLIRAHEEERALLARELHDDVSQRLAVLAIDVGRATQAAPGGEAAEVMRVVRDGLAQVSEDIHSLAYQLHPSVLVELGLVEALRTECERIGRRVAMDITMELDPLPAGVDRDTALCLFRVAQEALNNAARHADARAVSITLRVTEDGLLLAVRDDGVGFEPTSQQSGRSLGLASMRERVRLAAGHLDVESAPGQGTAVIARVPVSGVSP